MAGILWTIIVILVIIWIIGLVIHFAGHLIWIALAIAIILFIYNLATGRGARV